MGKDNPPSITYFSVNKLFGVWDILFCEVSCTQFNHNLKFQMEEIGTMIYKFNWYRQRNGGDLLSLSEEFVSEGNSLTRLLTENAK